MASTAPAGRIIHLSLARGYRGGERQTELLIRGLAAAGWLQRLVARPAEPLFRRCSGIQGLELAPVDGLAGAVRAVRHGDLLHVHEGRGAQVAFASRCLGGPPYLITRRVQLGPRRTWINRLMYRQAAAVVALSAAVAAALRRLDLALAPQIIPSAASELPVDQAQAARLRASFGGTFVAGHVGALVDAQKGQYLIIELARMLQTECPGLVFVLVGSGRDEARLRRRAAGLGNVHFTGEVERVGDYLAAFDLFLYPSRHEGLGSVLLDAMAQGLPVLASDAGGIPDIVRHEHNGLLFAAGEQSAFGAAFLKLYRDPELRERLAANNREAAAAYAPAIMAQRYAQLYRQLLDAAENGEQLS